MSTLKEKIKFIKRKINEHMVEKNKYKTKYKVEGTIKNKEKMLYVLSGYKQFLWKDVFERIKEFQTKDMEVCIVSSGKYCTELSEICRQNDWIYISTELNNVCVASNIVIREFPKAIYIYKLDEDIYIPKDYFKDMFEAYKIIEKESQGEIGYICPVLPLGFYGMHEFLIENNCLNEYEIKFGKHYLGGSILNPVFREGKGVDEFIWEKIGIFDECARKYKEKGFKYEACISRTGIAAILFKRDLWNKMGGLKKPQGLGIGDQGDEGQITSFCALNFELIYCVKNILVGHFSFGGSETNVLKFKEKYPEYFSLNYKKERK